jgi:4-hydroxy-tetrahydrodipicolinate synthase
MADTGLALYSGDDVLNLGWLTHGAAGIVSVVGHVAGEEYAAMTSAVDRGDLSEALAIYRRLVPVVDAMMNRAPGETVDHLEHVLTDAGLLEASMKQGTE